MLTFNQFCESFHESLCGYPEAEASWVGSGDSDRGEEYAAYQQALEDDPDLCGPQYIEEAAKRFAELDAFASRASRLRDLPVIARFLLDEHAHGKWAEPEDLRIEWMEAGGYVTERRSVYLCPDGTNTYDLYEAIESWAKQTGDDQ